MKAGSKLSKVLLAGVSTATLLTVVSPAIHAKEANSQQNTNQYQQAQQQEDIKEVSTYKEFKNAEGPVSINPANLSDKQLKDLGLNAQQTKQEFGIDANGVQTEATKKWSQKIPKSKITGTATSVGGVISLIGLFVSGGTVTTASGAVVSVFSGAVQASNINGVIVGGTATKRLVRENPYQKPVKKWVYKATWAKTY